MHKSTKNPNNLESGFSLVQVLAILGIFSVLTVAILMLVSNAQKATYANAHRLTRMDLERQFSEIVKRPAYCDCALRGLSFDTVEKKLATPPSGLPVSFSSVASYPAPCTPGPNVFLPPIDQAVPFDPTVTIVDFGLIEVNELGAGSGSYVGQFMISLKGDRQLKPILKRFFFSVDNTAGSGPSERPIKSCALTPEIAASGEINLLSEPVIFHCASNESEAFDTAFCSPLAISPVPANASANWSNAAEWHTITMPAILPLTAKVAVIEVHSHQTAVWVRRTGSGEGRNGTTFLQPAGDDTSPTTTLFFDVRTGRQMDFARRKTGGDASRVRFRLIGYME